MVLETRCESEGEEVTIDLDSDDDMVDVSVNTFILLLCV